MLPSDPVHHALRQHLDAELLLGVVSHVDEQVVGQEEAGGHDERLHDGGAVLHVDGQDVVTALKEERGLIE